MIVPMSHLTLLCLARDRENALERLREFGLAHLNLGPADSDALRQAQTRLAEVRRARSTLAAALADKDVSPALGAPHRAPGHLLHAADLLARRLPSVAGDAAQMTGAILQLADLRQELVNEADRLKREIACYAPFGSFDAALPARLAQAGLPVTLVRAPLSCPLPAFPGATLFPLAADSHHTYAALVGACHPEAPIEILPPPEASVDELRARLEQAAARAVRIAGLLKRAANADAELAREESRLEDLCTFATAAENMSQHGPVLCITGWVPADQAALLRDTAAEQAWGLVLRDPADDEQPPTLLRPPRLVRPMLSLFQTLGIAPAYRESDISLPFFCFFSIFFAMLVGDGGYGALILLLVLGARRKAPRAPRAPFVLLSVFSLATVLWGALSNTWFGFHPAVLDNAVSRWFAQPDGKGDGNMMLLCFTLGVAHLSVARVWNAVALFPDRKWLAQLGWLGVVWFMYFLAGNVVGVLPLPSAMKAVFAVSITLIALFSLRKSELKTNGAELGMLPLNIIGCLGDIISYVRLFAVGLAGVKVAENFNEMALGLDLPAIVKIPCLILILLFGHTLNFLMAGLSVLVHAVRLNTLEFSNHKGISWAGSAFRPFRRSADTA